MKTKSSPSQKCYKRAEGNSISRMKYARKKTGQEHRIAQSESGRVRQGSERKRKQERGNAGAFTRTCDFRILGRVQENTFPTIGLSPPSRPRNQEHTTAPSNLEVRSTPLPPATSKPGARHCPQQPRSQQHALPLATSKPGAHHCPQRPRSQEHTTAPRNLEARSTPLPPATLKPGARHCPQEPRSQQHAAAPSDLEALSLIHI